ncbi:MAG: hypothetical protein EOP49_40705 [Sphingobacteriales bacterium]|nr:MAG: hypothetical protein EOP49_40705 [Sphingobacteriales bacterium]
MAKDFGDVAGRNNKKNDNTGKATGQHHEENVVPGRLDNSVTDNAAVKNSGLGDIANSYNAGHESLSNAAAIINNPKASDTDKAIAAATSMLHLR